MVESDKKGLVYFTEELKDIYTRSPEHRLQADLYFLIKEMEAAIKENQ